MSTEVQPAPASTDGKAANKRALNEIIRADAAQGAPDRTMPQEVGKHYHKDGNAMRSAYIPDKIEFVDRGNRMHAYFPVSSFTVRSMVEVAEARGWKEMEVTGAAKFQQSIYIEAAQRGIGVKGYEPTQKDAEILQRREDRKAAQDNPMVQAFAHAESAKDRATAVKEYPKLKDAFAVEAAAKAFAEEKIDSKKAATNFVDRIRDNIAIALHTGKELPKVEIADRTAGKDQAQSQNQDRSR
ncbi:MAG: hypothetical protein LC098_04095 [Burkholderiales bacterium]|nr:hypothetical protein [Burkholderiales bacterium]